jgi:hypothetical protein
LEVVAVVTIIIIVVPRTYTYLLARTVEEVEGDGGGGVVTIADLELALSEVRPVLGKQDEVLEMRYPHGIIPYSPSMERIMRDLERFTSTPEQVSSTTVKVKPQLQSMLVIVAMAAQELRH